jgi:hypothetical protein
LLGVSLGPVRPAPDSRRLEDVERAPPIRAGDQRAGRAASSPAGSARDHEAERCSADPASLANIGRGVGHQVRIRRADVGHFVAVYTVSQANPDNPSRADVVRIGLTGRERLGTDGELDRAVVEARVVDAAFTGIRFFEEAEDTTEWPYLVVIAPHGGKIEDYTDGQATEVLSQLQTAGFPASLWICKGLVTTIRALSTAGTSPPPTFTRQASRCSGHSCRDNSSME